MPSNNANAQMKAKQKKNKNAGLPNRQGVPRKEIDPVEEAKRLADKKEKGRLINLSNQRKSEEKQRKKKEMSDSISFLEKQLKSNGLEHLLKKSNDKKKSFASSASSASNASSNS
jgi:hypothetical protein